jgi:hypothetical protein
VGLWVAAGINGPSAEALGYCQGRGVVAALKRWAIIGDDRDQRSRLQLDPGALEEGAQNFLGFEELAGDFAGG